MRAVRGEGGARPFWLLRGRAQAGTLAASGLVVLVVALLAGAMTGLALRSPTAAVRATIADEPAAATALALESSLAPDPAGQDAAVRKVLGKRFAGAPVAVSRTAYVPSAAIAGGGAAPVLVADDALRGRVVLTGGRWPSAGEVAVESGFARARGLAVGDRLSFAGASGTALPAATVAGVWRPAHPEAAAWLGLGGVQGRVIAPAALAAAVGDGVVAHWVVVPDAARVTAGELARLHSGFAGAADALTEDGAAGSAPFSSSGGAEATVAAMQRSVVALQAVIPVPLAVLVVCSLIALTLLARLLDEARRVETRLLRSRGAAARTLVAAAAVESGVVAVAGAVVGGAIAQLVLPPLVGGPTGALEVLLPPLLTAVAAVAVSSLTAALSARSAAAVPGAVEAGRGRTVVSAGLTVLAVIAAAVTLWRFAAFGPAAGGSVVDPTGVVAPAAVLCAIALVGLLLFGPAAAAVERVAGRGRGVAGVLPARQVGRGAAFFAGPVALIVLAVGTITFAAGYAGTFSGFLRDSALLTNGSAVRVDLGVSGPPAGPGDASDATGLSRLAGVTASAPALVDDATVGDADAVLVATDASRLPELTPVGRYLLDGADLSRRLVVAGVLKGAAVTGREATAEVAVTADGGAAAVDSVTGWFATEAGEAVPVTVASGAGAAGSGVAGTGAAGVAAPGSAAAARTARPSSSFTLASPPGGPWRLVALDVEVAAPSGAQGVSVRVSGLPAAAGAWTLAPAAFGSPAAFRGTGALAASAASLSAPATATARFLPTAAAGEIPVAVTTALAADDSLAVGQRIEVRGPSADLTGRVAAILPALPGTTDERAVFADLASVTGQLLRTSAAPARPTAVWLAADPGATGAVAARAQQAVPSAVVSTAEGGFVSRFLGGAVLSTWLGAAGCVLLAVAAVAAAIVSALRRRRAEVVVLRAVGLSGRQQAAARRLEVVGVSAAAVVFGLVGGVLVVLLVGNALARLSVVTAPLTLSVQGRVDPAGMAAGLGALVVCLGVAVWGYGLAVRRQAADTAYREETR